MKSRAQVSTEYLIIIAISMAILLPGGYFFYRYSVSSSESSVRSQMITIGDSMITSAESIYGLADGSLVTLDMSYPKNVRDVYVLGKRELVIRYELSSGINEAVFFSKVDISGIYTYPSRRVCMTLPASLCSDTTFTRSSSGQGLHKMKFESRTNGVFVTMVDDPGYEPTIFVTSTTYTGAAIGGLSGADNICQTRANAAGLGGGNIWKAWMSNCTGAGCVNGVTASSRLIHQTKPYVLPDGGIVAYNWADLTDGTLMNPINVTENGTMITGANIVVTGTNFDGDNFHNGDNFRRYCDNWVCADGVCWFYGGYTNRIDYQWTARSNISCSTAGCGGGGCTANSRLYCLKQN